MVGSVGITLGAYSHVEWWKRWGWSWPARWEAAAGGGVGGVEARVRKVWVEFIYMDG